MAKTKEFRDPVHGYIPVSSEFCEKIIDTPIFQRLREVEQTGMRVLFPGARHCRFSHSLGTYRFGQRAFRHFQENARDCFGGISEGEWASYEKTFSLACLLHDCAHSPFLHTFEFYYDLTPTEETSRLKPILLEAADNQAFSDDFTAPGANSPSPHEKAAAILVLTDFSKAVEELGGDPLLAGRMILGCRHLGAERAQTQLENCLISLLNGRAIDVDKLDYIMRDTWASGIDNASIDTHRLLSSLTYDEAGHRLAFSKSALSVLQSVIDARNYMHRWVFGHHKVVYNQYLLKTAVRRLASLLSPDDPDELLSGLFSVEALRREVDVCDGWRAYLPTDQDLTVRLRQHHAEIPEAEEFLFRQHTRKALWKTSIEFGRLFSDKTASDLIFIENVAAEKIEDMEKMVEGSLVVEQIPQKVIAIRTGEIMVEAGSGFSSYEQLFGAPVATEERKAFYIFVPMEHLNRSETFIATLQELSA